MAQSLVTRSFIHTLLTILMYTGVFIFLFPYLTGKASTPTLFLAGTALTILSGIARCAFTEDGCAANRQARQHLP
jgi:hypothetical protein